MTKTPLDLTSQEWQSYQLRLKNTQSQNIERWKQGWELVKTLANQLKDKFKAKKVVVFGSLLHLDSFHSDSDIDLAVWGIPSEEFYRAVAAVTGLSGEFEVDLVDAEDCLPEFATFLEQQGKRV